MVSAPTVGGAVTSHRRLSAATGGVRTTFEAVAPDRGFAGALGCWLGRLPPPPGDPDGGDLRFSLRPGTLAAPASPPRYHLTMATFWCQGREVAVRSTVGAAGRLNLETGVGEVRSPTPGEDAWWWATRSCLRPLWFAGLASRGQHPVHAAGVAVDGRGILVLGTSGAGKSTLAYHLASAGTAFLSDDTVFVSGPPPRVAGIGERIRLRAPGRPPGARGLVQPDGRLGITAARRHGGPVLPGLILLLEGEQGEPPRILSAAESMSALLHAWLLTLDPVADAERLVVLGHLAEAVPAVRLPVHPAPLSPDTLRDWMGG